MRNSNLRSVVLLSSILGLVASVSISCASAPTKETPGDWPDVVARIKAQMAAPDRHKYDLPRDPHRKPIEMYRILGVRSGMKIGDFGSGAGYNAELFAAAVGPSGKVWGLNTEFVLNAQKGYYKRTMDQRLHNDRLPNAEFIIGDIDKSGMNDVLDIAYWGNNMHDYYNREGGERVLEILASIESALKPGGVLGVTDHVGVPGKDNTKLHRMQPDVLVDLIQRAGFVVEEQPDMFRNSADDHSLNVYDEKIYRRTDRVFIKARKPE